MTWGIRIARWAWPVAAAAVVVLLVRQIEIAWDEARSIGSAPEYFNSVGHYRLSWSQAQGLTDIGLSPTWHAALVVTRVALIATTALVIAFLLWRRATTWAPLFLSWFLLNSMLVTVLTEGSTEGSLPPWLGIPIVVLFAGGIISIAGLLLVFPDDRSARWVIGVLTGLAIVPLFAGLVSDDDDVGEWVWTFGVYTVFAAIGAGLLLQIVRVARSRDRTARDLLALTATMLTLLVAMSIGSDGWSGITGSRNGLGTLVQRLAYETVYMAVPIVYGLAVLWLLVRRDHWDMDVQMRGSVGYAGLSTVLVLGYFGLVAVVQAVINDVSGTTGNTFALMITTAAIAATFLPLRSRLQALVDRLFDRRRNDAEQMVEAFESSGVRATRPDEVAGVLVDAVDRVFRPAHTELWTVRERER